MSLYPGIRIPAKGRHTASVIFVHGLGHKVEEWTHIADQARQTGSFDHVKFIFPQAPEEPITFTKGRKFTAWFDVLRKMHPDQDMMLVSAARIISIINEEIAAGIPPNRIVLAGFSQGCILSLVTSIIYDKQLAGVAGMSGYLAIRDKLKQLKQAGETGANKHTPYFLAHGTADTIILYDHAHEGMQFLMSELERSNVKWQAYPGLEHTTTPEEEAELIKFIQTVIPSLDQPSAKL